MTGPGGQRGGSVASRSFEEEDMKHFFEYLNTHQVAVLWFSVVFMVSISAFALLEAFDHLA
ncbi:MAG: hypothetical protein ACMG6H_01700 [Acidobacteriota bacterium]